MINQVKDVILQKIDLKIENGNKSIRTMALNERLHLRGIIDGLMEAREIIRLEFPDKDRLDVLIELISNSMDGKPQSVQIQNFELYNQISFAIAKAPKRYIIRLLQALHYFKNQLN